MCDSLFVSWPDAFPDKPARTQVHHQSSSTSSSAPPCSTTQTPPAAQFYASELPVSTSPAPPTGELLPWARLTDATWIAHVRFTATTGSRRGSLPMCRCADVPMGPSTLRPAEVRPDDISLLHLGRYTTARTVYGTLRQIQPLRPHLQFCTARARGMVRRHEVRPELNPATGSRALTMNAHATRKMFSAEA